MKVSAILKGKPDQFGRYPIVIRINEGEKRTFHVTPFRATKQDFDNNRIDEVTASKIRQLALRYETMALDGKKAYRDAEFFDYTNDLIKRWDKIRKYNTIRNYLAIYLKWTFNVGYVSHSCTA